MYRVVGGSHGTYYNKLGLPIPIIRFISHTLEYLLNRKPALRSEWEGPGLMLPCTFVSR